MYFISFLHAINILLDSGKNKFLAHNYILLIQLDVMDDLCEKQ